MATKFNRYAGQVLPFAINATGDNRTIFGDTTQSDDINDNLNDKFKLGWEIVGVNEAPTKQDFNALSYTTTYLLSYLYQQGVPEWEENQPYYVNSYAVGEDGDLYVSLTGDTDNPNVGNNPTIDNTKWKSIFTEVKKDISFAEDLKGVILIDRSDNTKRWRLFIDDGNLGIEEV